LYNNRKTIGVLFFVFRLGEIMDENKARNISPVVLAFVGDAVYSLFVRERLTFLVDSKSGELNKLATEQVKASAQAKFVQEVMPLFNEDELSVYKRARNAKKPTKAKSASVIEYNMSTGLEAVLGYLYLIGNTERLNFILNKGKE
jgi:ribonuclease-3 family protein